jgi:hypothetical protein
LGILQADKRFHTLRSVDQGGINAALATIKDAVNAGLGVALL